MFYLGSRNLDQVQAVVLKVPFVSPAMFLKTGASFQRNGIWALVKAPGNGISCKVYCVEARRYAGWPLFLAVSLLAPDWSDLHRFGLWLTRWAGYFVSESNVGLDSLQLPMAVYGSLATQSIGAKSGRPRWAFASDIFSKRDAELSRF